MSNIAFSLLQYFHQRNMTALMLAAVNGHSDIVNLLLEAGASIEAKSTVSKRISICTCVYVCVCVFVLYSCIIVLFYPIVIFYYCDM